MPSEVMGHSRTGENPASSPNFRPSKASRIETCSETSFSRGERVIAEALQRLMAMQEVEMELDTPSRLALRYSRQTSSQSSKLEDLGESLYELSDAPTSTHIDPHHESTRSERER